MEEQTPLITQTELIQLESALSAHNAKDTLRTTLDGEDSRAKACALTAGCDIIRQNPDIHPTILNLLDDPCESVRYTAILCAARSGVSVSLDMVQKLLKDPSPRVRRTTALYSPDICQKITVEHLKPFTDDSDEPTRAALRQSILKIQGEDENLVFEACPEELLTREVIKRAIPCTTLSGPLPLVDDWEAEWPENGGIAGAFLRRGMLESQGLFSFRAGQLSEPQTVIVLAAWGDVLGVRIVAYENADYLSNLGDNNRDCVTIHLGSPDNSFWSGWSITPHGLVTETPGSGAIQSAVRILDNCYEVHAFVKLPDAPSPGDKLLFNVGRRTMSTATGWGDEYSSWNYSCNTFDCIEEAGELIFTESPVWTEVYPSKTNQWVPDRDRFSVTKNHFAVIDPDAYSHLPHRPPLYLTEGDNHITVAVEADIPLSVFVGGISINRNAVFFPSTVPPGSHEIDVTLTIDSEHARAREWLILIDIGNAETGEIVQRITLDRIPLITPHHESLRTESEVRERPEFRSRRVRSLSSTPVEDLGPIAFGESYPMGLAWGDDGHLYGGTFPTGRLYSYHPVSDTVEEIGNPCEPHNHLESIVTGPNGIIYLGYVRPEGRLGCYDPHNGAIENLGVPVPAAIGGDCHVVGSTPDAVWGIQRGHLWNYHWKTGTFTDTGPFISEEGQVAPVWHAHIADESHIVVHAGDRLGWCTVFGRDVIRGTLTDIVITGRLVTSPDEKVFLCQADGTVWKVCPTDNCVQSAWSTDGTGIHPETVITMVENGSIFRAEHIRDTEPTARLWRHDPDSAAATLIDGLPKNPQYIPALIPHGKNALIGASAFGVYGKRRTTARLWRIAW